VITSSGAAGRLLGLSVLSPSVGRVMDDLITYGSGLDLVERPVEPSEAGLAPREVGDLVVQVKRGGELLDHDDPRAGPLREGDRLITIVRASQEPPSRPVL
jgi:voltage-gated potassium channel